MHWGWRLEIWGEGIGERRTREVTHQVTRAVFLLNVRGRLGLQGGGDLTSIHILTRHPLQSPAWTCMVYSSDQTYMYMYMYIN